MSIDPMGVDTTMYQEIYDITRRLNDAAEHANEQIRACQDRLRDVASGCESGLGIADRLRWERYDGEWCIVHSDEDKPLLSASRAARIRSVAFLPDLVRSVLEDAQSQAAEAFDK